MGAAGSQAPPLPCVLQASAATGSAGCAAREALLLALLLSAEHGGAYVKAPYCTGALAGRHAQAGPECAALTGWQATRAAQQAAARHVAASWSWRCLRPTSSAVLQGTGEPEFVNPSGAPQAAVGQVSAVARGWNGTLWIFHRGERVWDEDSFSADGRRITYNTPIAADTVVQINQVGPASQCCSAGTNRLGTGVCSSPKCCWSVPA